MSVMRVAIYTRISTDGDHQPYSLEAQGERLNRGAILPAYRILYGAVRVLGRLVSREGS